MVKKVNKILTGFKGWVTGLIPSAVIGLCLVFIKWLWQTHNLVVLSIILSIGLIPLYFYLWGHFANKFWSWK